MNLELLKSAQIGDLSLKNKLIMAPMTRLRATSNGVPTDVMAQYYAQRATAGLIITECTMVSPMSLGYMNVPGIYSQEQAKSWSTVCDAVHKEGGLIFLQLWHSGRVSHSSLLDGKMPLAPSSIAGTGDLHTPTGKHNLETPKKMSLEEIKEVTQQFGSAAKLAKEANFDGIEIHGAFGYLIDQFLQDVSNHRTDNYGGSTENRSRFALEILQTVCSVWDSKRVGIKLSPSNTFYGMGDSNPELIFGYLLSELNNLGLAYVHMMRPTPEDLKAGQTIVDTLSFARRFYNGTLIANGGFEKIEAETVIETGLAELVSFGRLFLANPDLPERFRCNASLNDADGRTFYGAGPDSIKGYTDYPSLAETLARG